MEDAAWGDHCNHTQTSNPASTVFKAFPNAVSHGSTPPPPTHLPPQPHLTPVPTPSPSFLAPLHGSSIGHRLSYLNSLPLSLTLPLSHILFSLIAITPTYNYEDFSPEVFLHIYYQALDRWI